MKRRSAVFWQNSLSIHQAPLIRELAGSIGVEVVVVVPRGVSAERSAMGWKSPDYGAAEVLIEPDEHLWPVLAKQLARHRVHVFSGLGAYRAVTLAMRELLGAGGLHLAVQTEPFDPRGIGGIARTLRLMQRRRLAAALDSLFAAGPLAVQQFSRAGVNPARIAPFGYFVEDPTVASCEGPRPRLSEPRRIIFVGSLEPRKDPIGLIRALSVLPAHKYSATIVGDGPLRGEVHAALATSGARDRTTIMPTLPNADVMNYLQGSDVLVLPSRFDGWGTVVSEALMVGTPAVVTSACGSADFIQSHLQGRVVPPGRPDLLARAIEETSEVPDRRSELRDWARMKIAPEVAAEYLWGTVDRSPGSPIPVAPWHEGRAARQ